MQRAAENYVRYFSCRQKLVCSITDTRDATGLVAHRNHCVRISAIWSNVLALGAPSLEQRVADLEAYVNNSARGADSARPRSSNIAAPGPSHNAWMMTCAALVLFMTLPGLALFYGGLVRAKNVLSVLAQCLGIAGLVTILWWAVGYSLVFSRGSPFIGGLKFAFLRGVDARPNGDYSYWVSQNVFAMYQLMFAIITPALIIGAVAERMKFAAVLVFVGSLDVRGLFPDRTHGLGNRWLDERRLESQRKNHRDRFRRRNRRSHELQVGRRWSCAFFSGTGSDLEKKSWRRTAWCFAWWEPVCFGWAGTASTREARLRLMESRRTHSRRTTLATAVASFTWAMLEYALRGKPSVLGFCSGAVGGLVVITPACGYVAPSGAVMIGIAAGIVPFFACTKLKSWLGYDDALDTFGVHAVGGTLGAFLTGFLRDGECESKSFTKRRRLAQSGHAKRPGDELLGTRCGSSN